MHLVFLNQYYPPDVAPTGVVLADLAGHLAANGHKVTVLCAAGGYADGETLKTEKLKAEMEENGRKDRAQRSCPTGDITNALPTSNAEHSTSNQEKENPLKGNSSSVGSSTFDVEYSMFASIPHSNPTILRIGATRFGRGTFIGKLIDYLSYYLGVAWRLLWMHPRPDRVVSLTTPPYLSVLARAVSRIRGADHAHWVMDLYPDVMVAHGMLREKSLAHRILAGLARWGFGGKRCAAIVTLGPCMAERVAARVDVTGHRPSGMANATPDGGGASQAGPNIEHRTSNIQWLPLWGEMQEEETQKAESGKQGEEKLKAESGKQNGGGNAEGGEDEVGRDRRARPFVPAMSHEDGLVASGAECGRSVPTSNVEHPTSKIDDPRSTISSYTLRQQRGWADDELVVMYSGNLGLGHRFGEILEVSGQRSAVSRQEEVIEPVAAVCDRRCECDADGNSRFIGSDAHRAPLQATQAIRFVFYGGGKRRGEIKEFMERHPGAPVELHDYAPAEILTSHLRSADVHLVSLDAAWTGTMVPSKLQGVFAVGRPVIFIGSVESSLGRWVGESGGGWLVRPGDVAGLQAAIDEASNPETRNIRGNAALDFARLHFNRETNVARIAEWFAAEEKVEN